MPKNVLLVMVWSDPAHHYGIAQYTRKAGWTLTSAGPGQEDMIRHARPDGIISQLHPAYPALISAVRELQVPMVELSDRVPDLQIPRVLPDFTLAGKTAAEHFVQNNFGQLAYIGRHKEPAVANSFFTGVKDAAESSGAALYPVFLDEYEKNSSHALHSYIWDSESIKYREWLSSRISILPKPLGVFSSELISCIDMVEGCLEAGTLIPEEVAVLTCAGYERECELTPVPLSSIALDYEKQGYYAAELLDTLMAGNTPRQETVYIPPKPVTVRESSDISAVGHRETAIIIGYIMRNLHNNSLSIDDIIRNTGISQGKLYYIFEKNIGRPIAFYIAEQRIKKAVILIKTRGMSSSAIAEKCGFTDVRHFYRTLKRVTGKNFKDFKADILYDDRN